MMRLTDLNPKWFNEGGGRSGQGVSFDCPHCVAAGHVRGGRTQRLGVPFTNPLDGGAPVDLKAPRSWWPALGSDTIPDGTHWQRTGDTFETLTLSPSVDASASGHWHGFVRNGAIV